MAESCTGGLLAARLTERPGSSAYVIGGAVVYSNRAKTELAGVDPELIAAHGAVSTEVARALADGARARFDDLGRRRHHGHRRARRRYAGEAGGLVWFSVAYGRRGRAAAVRSLTRRACCRATGRAVRDRATTVAMHLIARVVRGD